MKTDSYKLKCGHTEKRPVDQLPVFHEGKIYCKKCKEFREVVV